MKKAILFSAMMLAGCLAYGQRQIFIPGYDKEVDDEPVELFQPYETVHSGRELPRTFTVPYPDEESAVGGKLTPSLYLQPMDQAPSKTEANGFIDYTWKYKVPFAWVGRMVSLYVGSVDNPYRVIINGEPAGNNQSSRSPAEFDITTLSQEGINELTIRVGKNPRESVLTGNPGIGDITGKVLVTSQPKIRIRDYVYQLNLASDEPTLQLGFILKTQYLNPRSVRIHYTLRDSGGNTVASGHREAEVGLKEEDTVRFLVTVKDLKPWSYETPHLYDLTIKNQYEGRYTEYVNYRVGFRNIQIMGGELYTNGYKLPLAFYAMDRIPADGELVSVLAGLKSDGFNAVILPRYPQDESFYRACDSIGLYVCNQADIDTARSGDSRGTGGNPTNDPRWEASYVDRAVTMYGSSANHPSVAMFSIARQSSNGYNLYQSYLALKSLEQYRPVIYPEADGEWNSDAVTEEFAKRYPQATGKRIVLNPTLKEKVYPDKPYTVLTVSQDGTCVVGNNSLVTALRGEIAYTVKRGSKVISQGAIPIVIEPDNTTRVHIPVPESAAGKKVKFQAELRSNFD